MSASRRYMVYRMPVEHVNGKLANTSVRCPNTADGGLSPSGGFAYGYRRKYDKAISRFGVRVNSRSLRAHPYTAAESANRDLFRTSRQVVSAALANPARRAVIQAAYKSQVQRGYATLPGYATARVFQNGGVLPEEWNV